jgi:gliding motility-associated-like protein
VFNRWGSVVFSSKGYAEPWDGTYHGKELPAAVYYYIITIDEATNYSGSVTIIR